MLNKIVLIGRLTRDVDLKTTNSGKSVAKFTLAVDRPFKNQEGEKETDFININVWGNQGENCAKYIGKGRLVAVSGRLQIRNYEDNEGQRRYMTEVVADSVVFLDYAKDNATDTKESNTDDQFDMGNVPF